MRLLRKGLLKNRRKSFKVGAKLVQSWCKVDVKLVQTWCNLVQLGANLVQTWCKMVKLVQKFELCTKLKKANPLEN